MGLNSGMSDHFSIFQQWWASKSWNPFCWCDLGVPGTRLKGRTKIPSDRIKWEPVEDSIVEHVNHLAGAAGKAQSRFINVLIERKEVCLRKTNFRVQMTRHKNECWHYVLWLISFSAPLYINHRPFFIVWLWCNNSIKIINMLQRRAPLR